MRESNGHFYTIVCSRVDDSNLYNYFNGLVTDFEIKENKINLMFKNFNYIKD